MTNFDDREKCDSISKFICGVFVLNYIKAKPSNKKNILVLLLDLVKFQMKKKDLHYLLQYQKRFLEINNR